MPLVFAPHLVFDGSVGHHTSWIPRIKSYESHDHDEWVNPIPNPELIQKHPREVLGSLSLSSKKCWISWDHTWSCYAACVLCVVQPEQWNGASHTFETWRKLPWHTPGKWKNAILPAQEPKKSNKKMIKISSSWAPHKNSGHMWSALQCSCNASKLPLSNSNREIHAEQGRTNTP